MTDWETLKLLLDEFGISYTIEQGDGGTFRVKVEGSGWYYQHRTWVSSLVRLNLDFHNGGRLERNG